MKNTLEGKVAVVTGGASGIGLAIAKTFTENGASVIITDLQQENLDKAVAVIGKDGIGIVANVSKLKDMEAVYQQVMAKFGKLDTVVANAGLGDHGPLGTITEEQYDRTFNTNVKGVLFTVQPAVPLMKPGGTIIIIGSTGSVNPPRGMSIYGGSKAAVRNFIRSWVQDTKGTGIRFNVLSPGAIDTESLRNALEKAHGRDQVEAGVKSMGADTPAGRIGTTDEIGQVALFLASEASSFITGVEIFADGGLTAI
ncbi:NAD(P)-dependent dehydrogenase, short-chain alcohol dehydrogenase family [Mucilaginibacter lappiensis]|uniref:NAD(P)-dependent dehydrogenase (Short-subunit alcohol dehydrogenase family) n=1 Tax=Mucilaginibacter lappiensis TaxID=354630 RepID=A0ABR6PD23_9SPHI|nr:SDR family oxidoreductase [Mucilaginibacter lappiensis]MBB6107659.1 NAD(P)-dependent dehydrogenase (short-subunit alcohol dehydrogenase family) [Mucilaginibacter lappiensis]SIQ01378.1 NAD(P)-dependent dehydrogenase, short-chain alcohol dehydrogenase family [Mucilaginibacter lappiensis]